MIRSIQVFENEPHVKSVFPALHYMYLLDQEAHEVQTAMCYVTLVPHGPHL